MARMGRPPVEINWVEFEKLCAIHCTLVEMAGWFGVSEDTIERKVRKHYGQTFAEVYALKAGKGKISLRRKMFEAAYSGNTALLIWLSKQHLGMSEKVEQKTETKAETHVVFKAKWGSNTETTPSDSEDV